jgi:hypothetical protein
MSANTDRSLGAQRDYHTKEVCHCRKTYPNKVFT